MIAANLPALQVVLPLIAAPLCLLLRREGAAWALATAVTWMCLAIAILLLDQVMHVGPIRYFMGGWAPPWGIEYRIDALNGFVLLLLCVIAAVTLPYARRSVLEEIGRERAYLFYTVLLLCFTGLLGITATGDAFNLFVFLEISSLSSYILISMGRDRRALTASYQYLIMGTIGGTFVLIGVGYLYAATGTLNMMDLADRLAAISDSRTVRTGYAFILVGLSLKLALFPLHLWLPNAYTYAPSAVTVFLAATSTKVAVYAMLRFTFTVFDVSHAFGDIELSRILLLLAAAAIVFASISAIVQSNVKRSFAYSSVAQVGYMILGIALLNLPGLTGGIAHLFNHALAKGAIFMALGCVALRLRSVQLQDMAGIGWQMPWTMGALVIGGLSLIGVPLTAGFISKWYLLLGALEQEQWLLAVLILGGSLLAVIYVWRVIEAAYLQPAPARQAPVREAPLSMLVPTWLLALANVYFGVHTEVTVGVASRAARLLLGAAS